jgi:hypothetical protein
MLSDRSSNAGPPGLALLFLAPALDDFLWLTNHQNDSLLMLI